MIIEEAVVLVAQISDASNQQANAIAEVNRGIEQMSQVVQTNSATSQAEVTHHFFKHNGLTRKLFCRSGGRPFLLTVKSREFVHLE